MLRFVPLYRERRSYFSVLIMRAQRVKRDTGAARTRIVAPSKLRSVLYVLVMELRTGITPVKLDTFSLKTILLLVSTSNVCSAYGSDPTRHG